MEWPYQICIPLTRDAAQHFIFAEKTENKQKWITISQLLKAGNNDHILLFNNTPQVTTDSNDFEHIKSRIVVASSPGLLEKALNKSGSAKMLFHCGFPYGHNQKWNSPHLLFLDSL